MSFLLSKKALSYDPIWLNAQFYSHKSAINIIGFLEFLFSLSKSFETDKISDWIIKNSLFNLWQENYSSGEGYKKLHEYKIRKRNKSNQLTYLITSLKRQFFFANESFLLCRQDEDNFNRRGWRIGAEQLDAQCAMHIDGCSTCDSHCGLTSRLRNAHAQRVLWYKKIFFNGKFLFFCLQLFFYFLAKFFYVRTPELLPFVIGFPNFGRID